MTTRIITLLTLIFTSISIHAATFTSIIDGDWNLGATWGNSGDNVEGSGFPGAGDDVIIKNGATVTVNISTAKCANIQIGSNTNPDKGSGTLSFAASSQLTSSGTTSFGDGGNNGYLDMSAGGTFISNAWSGKKGSFTPGSGTVEYTGTFSLANSTSFDEYNELIVNGGNVTLSKSILINGDLTISSGTFTSNGKGLELKGDWNNTGGTYAESAVANEVVTFSGTTQQTITANETF